MSATRVACVGGGCAHHAREHWCLWPVLGKRYLGKETTTRTWKAGGCVAFLVSRPAPFFYSPRKNATLVHRTAAMATVWERGKLVLLGSRGLCGVRQCSSVASNEQDVEGRSPCRKCDAVLEGRIERERAEVGA